MSSQTMSSTTLAASPDDNSALSRLRREISEAIIITDPSHYQNFSSELFGTTIFTDRELIRQPSILSLFSSQPSSSLNSPIPPVKQLNYPEGIFLSPKNSITAVRKLGTFNKLDSFHESLNRLGVEIIDDDFESGSDSDGDESVVEVVTEVEEVMGVQHAVDQEPSVEPSVEPSDEPKPDFPFSQPSKSPPKSVPYTSSFVQSMSEYAFRREVLLQKIKDGHLVSSIDPSNNEIDKRQQVNIDLYSDYNQARRRHIKKHPQFISICNKLWNCVDLVKQDGGIEKPGYLLLVFKINCLIVPPPVDAVFAKKHAEEDWENDTNGKEVMGFDEFFKSIFQLVDTWTESCNSEDYIEMVLRLVDGICFSENGIVKFRADEKVRRELR